MVTGASASPGDGLGETSGDGAAALVATVKTPGRAKTTTAVTMRSRRYKDGLPVAVGVRGEAQSAHGSVDTRVDNSRASVECLQPGGCAVSRVVALRDGPSLLRHRPPRHGVAARRRAAQPGRGARQAGPRRRVVPRHPRDGLPRLPVVAPRRPRACLLYTSDAADDLLCVDL